MKGVTRVQIGCECGHTTTAEDNRNAEIYHLLHYRKRHAKGNQVTVINNMLAKRGYDP